MNVAPIWRRALGGVGLDELIERAAPTNGWGDVAGATEFLRSILRACRAAPRARVKVWR